jgi:cobalt-zinc-cadmium resistance protein CzcA
MVGKIIAWALANPLIVVLLAIALAVVGSIAFAKVNVEAYPDPAPAIVEVVAQYPGASAEEVERQVTIPLEVSLAGMPGLKYTRSKSLFGLAHLRNQFEYGIEFNRAKQEVLNRLSTASLPAGVTPAISPATPTGEIFRYTLRNAKDALGRDVYTLNDLKSLEDWTLERDFRRVPRIAAVTSSGGTVKRYEVHPDPDRLKRFGITLQQLQTAISNRNNNVGGDYLVQGESVLNVRGIGLIGGGENPVQQVLGMADPRAAAARLRAEEAKRLREMRRIVITSVNNVPIRVEDVVEGGPTRPDEDLGRKGVIVGHQTRLGKVSLSRPQRDAQGNELRDKDGKVVWQDEEDKVQGIVLLRKGEDSMPALRDAGAKLKDLNERAGRLLPGVKLEPYYDRTDLIQVTTETVRENLALGMVLVTIILLMFLNNVRSALIVAINIPLALLFAFAVLFVRGRSANLLSIGAVDFGIIVDSTVIMVENIYRYLGSGQDAELPLKERILLASREVERSLFYSTIIMVCALLPLFTMQGPEGQIFGPMADTYAFALGGALVFALTVSPVLCLLLFKNLKPSRENWLVRCLKAVYLWQLERVLNYRWLALTGFGVLTMVTVSVLPLLGSDFMPELEEGNLYIRGTFPVNVSLEEVSSKVRIMRSILREYPEVEAIVPQIGRPDDGTDPTGFYNVETFVPLKPERDWPAVVPQNGWMKSLRKERPRTKAELVEEMNHELDRTLIGVDWDFSQIIRDNVMEALSGVKGENSVKIFGPDLDHLEELADRVKTTLDGIDGIENAGVFRIKGQSNLELRVDREKCAHWGVSAADVNTVIESALRGKPVTQMIEGENLFDISLRWPERLRNSESCILDIPIDITNNTVTAGVVPSTPQTPLTGSSSGTSPLGSSQVMPSPWGNLFSAPSNTATSAPRRRLRDLVTPADAGGVRDRNSGFIRPGASTIYREQGGRFIAVKFGVRGRDLASAVAAAQSKTAPLIQPPYRTEWSGEFQEMQEAQQRLLFVVSISMALILLLLYLAFHSLLDAFVVLSNVVAMSLGGVWALLLTGVNFNISAAVGFISILGVAVMNGLLMVSNFNHQRAVGMPLRESIVNGVAKLIRPVTMTALAAILGLLPAALSTRIGAQSQRPLAIVVVGGMITTLLLTNLVPVLYSFYGQREPGGDSRGLAH